MKKFSLLVLIPLLAAALLVACSSDSGDSSSAAIETQKNASSSATQSASVATNNPASGLRAADLDGNWHTLDEWIGQKPVVINIWGTWCPPCRREIPDLVRLYAEYGDSVEMVSFALERRAGPEQVKQFTESAGMTWVQLIANEDILRAFGYDGGVPTTIFLTRDGKVVNRHVGGRPYDTFKRDFETISGT
jgi:thiol-disulfide isomerase/thioredoxin